MNEVVGKIEAMQEQALRVRDYVNDFAAIKDFVSNRVGGLKLKKRQKKTLERYQFIYGLLSKIEHSDGEIVAMCKAQFGTSPAQAYRDIGSAKDLYNTTLSIPKRLEVKLMIDLLKAEIAKARKDNDGAVVAKLSKEMRGYLDMIEDENDSLKDLMVPHTNIIEFNPALIGVEASRTEDIMALFEELTSKHKMDIEPFIQDAILIEEDENE